MKKIVLTGSSIRNNGHFVDAGETVEVGAGDAQINADRAKGLIDEGRAMTVAEAKAAETPATADAGERAPK